MLPDASPSQPAMTAVHLSRRLALPWQQWLLGITTLYTFVLLSIWDSALVAVPALIAFLLAVWGGSWQLVRAHYLPVLWLWALLLLVNATMSVMPGRAITGAVHLLRGLAMLLPVLLLLPVVGNQRCMQILKGLLIPLALLALLLSIAVAAGGNAYATLEQLAGQYFGNLHNLANLTSIALIASLVLLYCQRDGQTRLLMLVCAACFTGLLVLLRSEGSWLGLIAMMGAWVALLRTGWLRGLAIVAVLAMVALLHLFFLQPTFAQALTGLQLPTLLVRAEIYAQLLEHWQQAPLTGLGMHSYKYLPVAMVEGKHYLYPHHIYLEALFSLGVLGCGLLLVLLFKLARFSELHSLQQRPLALLGALVLCYLAVKGMTDMKLFSAQTFSQLVMCIGLMAVPPTQLAVSK